MYVLMFVVVFVPSLAYAQELLRGRIALTDRPHIGSPVAGTGNVMIERHGEHVTAGRETAPYATTKVNSGTAVATNPNVVTSLAAGSHTATASDVNGLVEMAGTCTYPTGGTECTVTSFGLTPTCASGSCSVPVSVTDGQVTKVAFKYAGVYDGWGADTVGGKNGTVVHVTNCNLTGTGSLNAAIQGGANRYIVFNVSCTGANAITCPGDGNLYENINVTNGYLTIDGFTAPSPGITLRRCSVDIENTIGVAWSPLPASTNRNVRDLIVRGLRLEKEFLGLQWAIVVKKGYTGWSDANTPAVFNVVIAHNSLSKADDDMLLLSQGTNKVTVVGNLFSDSPQHMLLEQKAFEVSTYLNFFGGPQQYSYRNPMDTYVTVFENRPGPTTMTQDIKNNYVYLCAPTYGITTWRRSKVNIQNNALVGCSASIDNTETGKFVDVDPVSTVTATYLGQAVPAHEVQYAYVDGNEVRPIHFFFADQNNRDYNHDTPGTPPTTPLSTPTTPMLGAFPAACKVLAEAGVFPRSTQDLAALASAITDLASWHTCP